MYKINDLLLLGFMIIIFSGCTKEIELSENKNEDLASKILSMDENFNDFVNSYISFSTYITDNFKKSDLDLLKLNIQSNKFAKLNIDNQYNKILEVIKLENKKDLVAIFEKIYSSQSKLFKQKYADCELTRDIFEKAVILKQQRELLNTQSVELRTFIGYTRCSAAVAFEGALMLGACEAITGGIGTPFCIAGASIWAADGIANCRKIHLN